MVLGLGSLNGRLGVEGWTTGSAAESRDAFYEDRLIGFLSGLRPKASRIDLRKAENGLKRLRIFYSDTSTGEKAQGVLEADGNRRNANNDSTGNKALRGLKRMSIRLRS